jgi:hypothetical protein
MFGFVLLAFLLLAVVLAVAVFFAFKSGNAGQTKLSGPAGCLIALALLVIAGVGAVGLGIVAVVTLSSEAVKHGPVKSFELQFPEDEGNERAGSGMGMEKSEVRGPHLTIELRGLQDPADVMKWLRKRTDSETRIAVHEGKDKSGKVVTVIELTLPEDHDVTNELRDMRRDLERDVPDLRLPKSVRVEFRGPEE